MISMSRAGRVAEPVISASWSTPSITAFSGIAAPRNSRECRYEIDLTDERNGLRTGGNLARPADDKRHAMAAFPRSKLEAQQFSVQSMPGLPCLLTGVIEHAPVVAGENDQCVLGTPRFIKRSQHLADDPIKFVDEVAIQPALAGHLESRMRRKGVVIVGVNQDNVGLLGGPGISASDPDKKKKTLPCT
jgi:hypothetical protein